MASFKSRKQQFLIWVILWCLCLLASSQAPHDFVWTFLPSDALNSAAHTVAYGFLTYLLCFYLRFRRALFRWRMTDLKVYFFACLFTLLWGGVTELGQMLRPDRYSDWSDFFFNALGSLAGVIIFLTWQFFHHRRAYPVKRA